MAESRPPARLARRLPAANGGAGSPGARGDRLVYLAEPDREALVRPGPGPQVPGTGRPDRVAALFVVTFAAADFSGLPESRISAGRRGGAGRRVRAGRAGVRRARPVSRRPTHLRGRDGGVPAATRVGWAAVGVFVAVSLIVPWAHGWTVDGPWPSRSSFRPGRVGRQPRHPAQRPAGRGPERDHPAGPGRAAQPVRPRPARHPRPLADRRRGQGGAGRRLTSLDPQRAGTEIADVEWIARQALADVRAAAAGYREVTLAGELASARTALGPPASRRTCPIRTSAASRGPGRSSSAGRSAKASPTWCGTAVPPAAGSGSPPARSDHRRRLRAARPGRRDGSRRARRRLARASPGHRGRRVRAGLWSWPGRPAGTGRRLRRQGTVGRPAGGGFALRVRMP